MKTKSLLFIAILTACLAAVAPQPVAASASVDLAKQLNQAFIEVADTVSPAVVVITVTQKADVPSFDMNESPWDLLPPGMRRQFRRQFEDQAPEKTHGQGSGVIVRKDGYILTNRHVVGDAERIEVRLKDGRRFNAVVRGEDPQSDVAVLKIDAGDLPVARLGDSAQTRVGEFAIAIGAPFSLDYSVTFGHVSAKGRSGVIYDPFMDQEFIQTDANINPGNSGGPLVNINGEVIGINTLIRGLHTGIGFAIPINLAKEVAEKLIADGRFPRVWLGIGIMSYGDLDDAGTWLKGVREGVVVKSIEPDGPAAKSDLRPADVITAIDGTKVATVQQLKAQVRRKSPGQVVVLAVVRDGQPLKVKVTTEERENGSEPEVRPVVMPEEDTPGIGVTVQTLTHQLADQLGTAMTRGVVVTSVEAGSVAGKSGISPGDIITEVNHQPVGNPKQFREALKGVDLSKGVIVNFISGRTQRFEILKQEE